jgi:hypothetical protein
VKVRKKGHRAERIAGKAEVEQFGRWEGERIGRAKSRGHSA